MKRRVSRSSPSKHAQAIRQRKAQRRARRGRRRVRNRQRLVEVAAPPVLSVFDGPDATFRLIAELRAALAVPHTIVRLDLSGVTRFTSDSLLLIRAVMKTAARGCGVEGNLPRDPKIAAKVKASGFFDGFHRPPKNLPKAEGLMQSRSYRKVYSEVAAALVRFAMAHTSMQKAVADASSQTLIEAMTNTHAHADGMSKERVRNRRRTKTCTWFAGVYCEEGVASFTFVDLGVGLLQSADARHFLKKLGLSPDVYGGVSLMRDLFNGVVGSATGIPGRGHGLPDMRTNAETGLLPDLRVASSSVVGQVSSCSFVAVDIPIRGTILRWRSSA